jgi:hypothetical protein
MNWTMLIAPWVENAGWALLHSLWQCTLIAMAAATLLGWLRGRLAVSQKHWVFCGALLAMVILPFGIYGWLLLARPTPTPAALPAMLRIGASMNPEGTVSARELPQQVLSALNHAAPWVFWAWSLGISVSFFRLLLGWRLAHKLTRWQATAAPEQWRVRFDRLARALGLPAGIELRSSLAASVPCLIGWFKPIVLVPASAFPGMA